MARILKMIAFTLMIALLIPFVPQLESAALAETDGMVRVKLTRLGTPTSVSFTTGCDMYLDSDLSARIPSGAKVTVSVSGGDLLLKTGSVSLNMGSSFSLNRKNAGTAGVKFTSPALANVYCGDLLFSIESGRVVAVLRLYVEDYLYGVVGYEMSNGDPIEALKVQAIAARNYVLRNKSARTSKKYDVVDTSSDQVFKGYNSTYKNVIKAVDDTRGMVLTYDGKLAACFYGSSNGGQTESTKNAWGSSLPYSVVKDDRFDLESTGVTKSVTLKKDLSNEKINSDLRAAFVSGMKAELEAAGLSTAADDIDILTIVSIEGHSPRYAEPSRLYKKLKFTLDVTSLNDDGERIECRVTADVPTYDGIEDWFKLSINSKDTETVWVHTGDTSFTISFRRNGHGVGMSQRGSKVMAKNYDMSCETILDFYYPGTKLTRLTLADTTGSGLKNSGDNSVLDEPLEPVVTPTPQPTVTPAPTNAPDGEKPAMQATIKLASKSGKLNVRKEPTTASAIVGKLGHGVLVDVYALNGKWVRIGIGDRRGYVMKQYLAAVKNDNATPAPTTQPTLTPTPTAAPEITPKPTYQIDYDAVYAQVKLSSRSATLKLRAKPSTSSAVVTYLKNGQYLLVTALSGNWAKVETASGHVGYASVKYLRRVYPEDVLGTRAPSATASPTPTPAPTNNGEGIRCITKQSTFVFQKADVNSVALMGLDKGDYVLVTAYNSKWAYVITGDTEGYVPTTHLKVAK